MEQNSISRVVKECQICGSSDLKSVLFLGYLPPVNDFHPIGERPKEEPSYPAEILHCEKCHLIQSGFIVDPKIIFPPSYPYTSSTTRVLRDNFAELYQECSSMFELKPDDLVVDVGSNDGNLLNNFKGHHKVLGITPEDIGKIAIENGIPTILNYFTKEVALRVKKEYGPARIVTATNVFAHIDNVNEVVESILEMLAEKGIFIIESHYVLPVIQMNQFDTIYHEHLRHYSIHSLKYLLEAHGLEIIHTKPIPSHAGSIRAYAARKGDYPIKDTVAQMMETEKNTILKDGTLAEFRKKTIIAKLELMALLRDIKKSGGRIYGIGAPSRGTTLINYTGIDEGIVDCILEIKGSHKIGKYVPGTLIPVFEESKLFEDQPEYALLFSWQITDELIPKLKEKGFKGKFIIPLPSPHIV
ncbi:MAG: class I SAM-dependent methyltransferase [Patescibacteria group bacterium]